MERNRERTPGGPLSQQEQALLEFLCAGEWPGAQQAREQAKHALWGGWEHDECECFLLEVPQEIGLEKIPQHPGGPFSGVEVLDGEFLLGHLNLWVQEGRLHSVDYVTFEAPDDERLPAIGQLGGEASPSWLYDCSPE